MRTTDSSRVRVAPILVALVLASAALPLPARSVQDDAADPILAEDLEEHIDILSSDAFEGRGTGTRGERRAAGYIISLLEEFGLRPAGEDGTFLQSFPVPRSGGVRPPAPDAHPHDDDATDDVAPDAAQEAGSDDGADDGADGHAERGDADAAHDDAAHDDAAPDDAAHGDARDGDRRASIYDFDDGRNILALWPGSDPELAHEYVVVGAHYDHVGPQGRHGGALGDIGQVHNGADDNASGSALLLELAAYLSSTSAPPRRSVLFQWYSGEELGLLGSMHWVAHPTRPLEDAVAMLNFDMVGRLLGGTLMVGGVGTSPGFRSLVAEHAEPEGIEPVFESAGGAPTDSLAFYQREVPVLFLFTGVHGDYHRATDDAHKINASGAERVGRLALRLLLDVANADERPPFTSAPGMAEYWTPRVVWGLTLDDRLPADGRGVTVAVVLPDSPAGRAGLRDGDILLAVDGEDVRDPSRALSLLEQVDDDRTPRLLTFRRPAGDGGPGEQRSVSVRPEIH